MNLIWTSKGNLKFHRYAENGEYVEYSMIYSIF